MEFAGNRFSYVFGLGVTSDGEDIALERCLSSRIVEVDHRSIVLEEIHFFDALNRVHSEFLKS